MPGKEAFYCVVESRDNINGGTCSTVRKAIREHLLNSRLPQLFERSDLRQIQPPPLHILDPIS